MWEYIAKLQQQVAKLLEEIRVIKQELLVLRRDVNYNEHVFVKLHDICEDMRSDSEISNGSD